MLRFAIFTILLTSIGRPFSSWSQTLHTPAQVLEIMKRSTVNYTVNSLTTMPVPNPGKVLTRKDVATLLANGQSLPLGAEPKGFKELREGECDKAIKFLIKKSRAYQELSLSNQLDFCECLQKTGEWELSVQVLKPLEATYPRHYEIARKLAKAHNQLAQPTQAFEKISKAWMLNRNHSIIRSERIAMAAAMGIQLDDWQWSPSVKIQGTRLGPIISVNPPNTWLAYGLCEALWQYEPGYASNMQQLSNRSVEEIRATECLMNAMIAYSHDSQLTQKIPAMEALKRAVDQQLTHSFILFEIQMPRDPSLVYALNSEELANLSTYLKTCR